MRRILWFRRDLRVEDNPLLSLGGEVLPIFIFDRLILSRLAVADRRLSYIFAQVIRLKEALQAKGLDLKLYFADPLDVFASLSKLGFEEVAASGDYDAYARERDLRVSHIIDFNYLHDTYIFRPEEVCKTDGSPYLVFTPFYKRAKALFRAEHMQKHPFVEQQLFPLDYEGIMQLNNSEPIRLPLELTSIGFRFNLPEVASTDEKLDALALRLNDYAENRDFLSLEGSSDLSLELRFGTLSIRALLRFLRDRKRDGLTTEPFFRQLIFREFYASLLYHFPHLATQNFRYAFKGVENIVYFQAFCEGRTGVPIVDAGVRELLETGKMHNRVRMICASFFTKDLLLPWQWGETFFAQHLLDYDAASNILSWQWSAGTGVDPQPYFRVFNPYLQSKKFDKEARYIKKWLPLLTDITPNDIHNEAYLLANDIEGYCKPIVIHKEAAKTAIRCFKES